MGLVNFLMVRSMKKEAKRVADIVTGKYIEYRRINRNEPSREIIKWWFIEKDKFESLSDKSKYKINICCKNLYGLCYVLALDGGHFGNMMRFRCIQFMQLIDDELHRRGIAPISRQEKEKLLEVMDLLYDGWEEVA